MTCEQLLTATEEVPPFLDVSEAQRLIVALLGAYQTDKIKAGKLSPDAHVSFAMMAGDTASLHIDEASLGIDSLALLDIVAQLTRFFGLASTGVEDYLLVQKRLSEWADLVAHHFALVGTEAQITFHTSGSTGAAKSISHHRCDLEAEIAGLAETLFPALPQGARFLSPVPPQHIYGFLWSVLLPARHGVDVIDLHSAAPSAIVRHARPGDVIIATPYLWEKYAEYGMSLPAGISGVSSGGPTTRATWDAAAKLGVAQLTEVYGSTETGGLGWRRAPDAPFTVLPHLRVRNEQVMRAGNPAPLKVQDHLNWEGDRQFRVTGRKDRVVQVAGTNVCLDRVEGVLLALPSVQRCAVRLDGQRLKAFIVPKAGEDQLAPDACRAALAILPAVAQPEGLTFGPRLPMTASGKLTDW